MRVSAFLLCLIALVAAQTTISNLRTKQISTQFNGPIAVEFYPPTNNIIVSSFYPNGQPHNFRKIDSGGVQTQWSTASGQHDEIMVTLVRDGNTAGFIAGDLFTGNGLDGQIQRISNGGNTVYNNWCIPSQKGAPGSIGLLRGGLEVDKWNNGWKHNLVICTTGGYILEITFGQTSCATVTVVGGGSAGVFFEGITTTPIDPRYGQLQDSILVGAEQQGRLWAVRATSKNSKQSWAVGCNIEDIDIILPNQNYFVVNYGSGRLLAIDYTQFAAHHNKILLVSEEGRLWELLTPATGDPSCSLISYDPNTPEGDKVRSSFENAVFAPAGIAEVLPSDFSLCLTVGFNAEASTGKNAYYTVKYTLTNTALTNYAYSFPSGSPIVPPYASLAVGTLYFWFGQDYRNEFTLTVFVKPTGAGSLELDYSSSNAGTNVNTIVQDDPASADNSYYYVQSTGAGQFKWVWTGTETSGMVLGPLNFLDAQALFRSQFTVKSFSGISNVQVLGSATGDRVGATITGWPAAPRALTAGMTVNFARVACNCGDGNLQRLEQCDLGASNGAAGSCCDAQCMFRPASYNCRAAAGSSLPCDAPDYCTGSSGSCPQTNYNDGRLCAVNNTGPTIQCAYCQANLATCNVYTSTCPTCDECKNGATCSGGQCICTPDYSGTFCDIPRCEERSTCDTCNTHPECGWCCKEQKCVRKDVPSGLPHSSVANSSCDLRFWRNTTDQCVCQGANLCLNNGTCDVCGFCQCVPPFGGPTCLDTIDCLGVLNGTAKNELCGCNAGNTSCIGCDGMPHGPDFDKCGVCGGFGETCYKICSFDNCEDCATAENCGWCAGDGGCKQIGVDDTSSCKQVLTNRDDCGLNLTTEEIAGIAAGIIALIVIIVIIVVAALVAGGSYAGYKYWSKYRANMGAANTNPLYKEGTGSGTNPLFQDKGSD